MKMKMYLQRLAVLFLIILLTSCSTPVYTSDSSDTVPETLSDYLSSALAPQDESKITEYSTASQVQSTTEVSSHDINEAYEKYSSALDGFLEISGFSAESEAVIVISGVAEFNLTYGISEVRDGESVYFRSQLSKFVYDSNAQISESVFTDKYSDGETTYNRTSPYQSSSSGEITSEPTGSGTEDLMSYINYFDKGNVINLDSSSDDSGLKLIFTLDPSSMKAEVEEMISSLNYEDIRMTAYVVTANINNDGYLTSESINVNFYYDTGYREYSGTVQIYTQINDINGKISIDAPDWL